MTHLVTACVCLGHTVYGECAHLQIFISDGIELPSDLEIIHGYPVKRSWFDLHSVLCAPIMITRMIVTLQWRTAEGSRGHRRKKEGKQKNTKSSQAESYFHEACDHHQRTPHNGAVHV